MSYADYHRTMQDLYDKAPPRIRFRAKGYLFEDRIVELNLHEGVIEAKVQGTQEEPYDVRIHLKNRRRHCTCPAHHKYRQIPCKHQVLAVLPFLGTDS